MTMARAALAGRSDFRRPRLVSLETRGFVARDARAARPGGGGGSATRTEGSKEHPPLTRPPPIGQVESGPGRGRECPRRKVVWGPQGWPDDAPHAPRPSGEEPLHLAVDFKCPDRRGPADVAGRAHPVRRESGERICGQAWAQGSPEKKAGPVGQGEEEPVGFQVGADGAAEVPVVG